MLEDVLIWSGLVVSGVIGFIYFRGLGNATPMLVQVKRENMVRLIRHEYRFLAIGALAAAVMIHGHIGLAPGPHWVFISALLVLAQPETA